MGSSPNTLCSRSSYLGYRGRYKGLLFTLLLVALVGVLFMPREEYIADPLAMRGEAVSLLQNGTLSTPPEFAAHFGERGQFFVENSEKGAWYCKYGIVNSLIYLPLLVLQKWREGSLSYLSATRLPYLNAFNLIITLFSAVYLYLIAGKYTKSSITIILFLLSSFYATCWWYYQRGQNSEVYQVLWMLGFYYHFVQSLRGFPQEEKAQFLSPPLRSALLAGLFLGLLIATKLVYFIIVPLAGLFLLWQEHTQRSKITQKTSSNKKTQTIHLFELLDRPLYLAFPVTLMVILVMFVNNYKFGSPFASGYGQWQERGMPIFSGNILKGLEGFLLHPQYTIFTHFPLLVFSLFGYQRFWKRYRNETFFVLAISLTLLLINAKFLGWNGGWGYGPRYLIEVLPLLSLPFISTIDFLLAHRRKWWATGSALIIAATLLYSVYLQFEVARCSFFLYFRLEPFLEQIDSPLVHHYVATVPFGIFNRDILRFNRGGKWEVMEEASRHLSRTSYEQLCDYVKLYSQSNFYWFPEKKEAQ